MISDGFNKAEESEFFEKYNIELIRYNNRMESTLNSVVYLLQSMFIVSRGQVIDTGPATPFTGGSGVSICFIPLPQPAKTKTDKTLRPLLLFALLGAGAECATVEDLKEQTPQSSRPNKR